MTASESLSELLATRTGEAAAELVRPVDDHPGWVRCLACGHRCRIAPGRAGVCRVRFNEAGALRVPRGYVAGLACDPIEKKPFYHVDPGGLAVSFGMLGCDLHCSYCQNWDTSQVLRDEEASGRIRDIEPAQIVESALRTGAGTVVSTYNEPLITSEWAVEVFRLAKEEGLRTAFVSNGNGTPEVLDYLAPVLDFCKVDLKGFDEASYRKLGGELENVTATIAELVRRGIWCEVVTLIVPGLNDGTDELERLTGFLASVSRDIPWHCTAFHPDYRMTGTRPTSTADLLRAWEIGRRAGLRYVYPGNLPGEVGDREHTKCPGCGELVVERWGFRVLARRLDADGRCAGCRLPIPGRWETTSRRRGSGIPMSLLA